MVKRGVIRNQAIGAVHDKMNLPLLGRLQISHLAGSLKDFLCRPGIYSFFLFRALDMVAAENPVASLIRLIVVFIDSSPFVFCLSDCINIIINILNNFAIFL